MMRSIRRSLTLYFLLLVGIALGGVCWLVYANTQATILAHQKQSEATLRSRHQATADLLRVKNRATRTALQAKLKEDKERERAKLDEKLLSQARTLARLVQFQFDVGRTRFMPLGALSALTTPNGGLLIPAWVVPWPGPPHQFPEKPAQVQTEMWRRVWWSTRTEVTFKHNDLLEHLDEQVAEYFQVNAAWGSSYQSHSLGGRNFAFDPRVFRSQSVLDWKFEDVRLGDLSLRLVGLKAPAARYVPYAQTGGQPRFGGGPQRRGHERDPKKNDPKGPPAPRNDQFFRPAIYIQVACDTAKRDTALAALEAKFREDSLILATRLRDEQDKLDAVLQGELARVEEATTESLQRLRTQLLVVCLLTFAATVVGGAWLVRLGLAPVSRLSEAVSHVSEKQFKLKLDDNPLPKELVPIKEGLTHTLAQLERAFAREKQATADISHELRTPVAALLTTTEVALRKQRSAQEYREALEDCRLSGQQMHQAVERLLALARLDAGVDQVRPRVVDVAELAETCVACVRPLAEERGLTVQVKADAPATVQTDPDKLREVLNNLLHNAIQYNKPAGAIDVVVARNQGQLEVAVRDTGVGIPPDALGHIFERFYRVDPARQTDGMNTGLGLAIVKGYVDLLGGRVAVDSVVGQGSTFRVSLPA